MPYKNNEDKLRNAARYRAIPENRDRNVKYARDLYAVDKQEVLKDRKQYYAENRDRINTTRKNKKYKMSEGEFEARIVKQGNRCLVCGELFKGRGRGGHAPVIDHCHHTNKVRGILHNVCNSGMGLLRDNPVVCEQAAQYLKANG